VTKGMDIALVEYEEKYILLIDCEGLKSASKPMDPKLMLIMSMISQKMIKMHYIPVNSRLIKTNRFNSRRIRLQTTMLEMKTCI
jgi:hypothetical protein